MQLMNSLEPLYLDVIKILITLGVFSMFGICYFKLRAFITQALEGPF
jgi:hypothetical protein